MTREEHLRWAKERALEYVQDGELADAVASMSSNLDKHPELGANPALVMIGMMAVIQHDAAAVRRWIEDFR
jgi:hypothetical protein